MPSELNDQKVALYHLKEELFYTVDEKTHESDLTEMGRTFLNPDDPDAFVLPDLASGACPPGSLPISSPGTCPGPST